MWFGSTALVADYPVQQLRRGRRQEKKREALIRATLQLQAFALGSDLPPNSVRIDASAKVIDVHGRIHWKTGSNGLPSDSILGVTGTAWQSVGTDFGFFGDTAITRTALVDQSTVSTKPIIWTVTWKGGRHWVVLSSHASFAEYPVWDDEDGALEFAGEVE